MLFIFSFFIFYLHYKIDL